MDKKKSILNVSTSILSRIVLLIAALFVRRLLIQYIGNDVNGLNSLYTSIISMLAVAELGVGSAIVFSMYSPIVAGDKRKVAALYCLYKSLYRIIGGVIFAAGLVVMPFLPSLISDYEALNVNVYLTFFLTLVSVVLSYVYSAKTSLIEAYKDNYLTTVILTVSKIFRYLLQVASIMIWASYTVFLICQIIETMLAWALTEREVRKKHADIIAKHEQVDDSTKTEIVRNVKAMFMHKIGIILVNTIDSVIISAFIGVTLLGEYSNYSLIAGHITGIIMLFFSPLTSVVGHLCAAGDRNEMRKHFNRFYNLNFLLGLCFYLGYFAVIDNVVAMVFGRGLEMSRAIAFIISLNQFTYFMRRTSLLFRDASGTFYYDRWKPLAEGIVNLALSLLFVNLFPEDFRIVGVIVATIITTLLICDTVEPYVVFKYVFSESPKKFYLRNYVYTGIFILCLLLMNQLVRTYDSALTGFVVNGGISLGLTAIVVILLAVADKKFRDETRYLIGKAREVIARGIS